MSLLVRFDRWVAQGPFTASSLGRYRIIFGVWALITLLDLETVGGLPRQFWAPPPGPYRLLDGFPPLWFVWSLKILLGLAYAAILIGWHTRATSIIAPVLAVLGSGFYYSVGKIDHGILFVLTPLLLGFAGWGNTHSVDAMQGRSPGPVVNQAAMRIMALAIGVGMFTAATRKAFTGWLDPATHATMGYFMRRFFTESSSNYLASMFGQVRVGWLWEPLDWVTILIEGGMIFAVLNWTVFRVGLAVLATFHLMVLLVLNISFSANPVVYAAFIAWGAVPWPSLTPTMAKWLSRLAPIIVAVLAAAAIGLHALSGWSDFRLVLSNIVVFAGAVVGVAYLVRLLHGFLSERRAVRLAQ